MPEIAYKVKHFREEKLRTIGLARQIVADYQGQGFNLTVRQLYYHFVSHDLFPEDRRWKLIRNKKWVRDPNGTKNAEPNYKWLSNAINDARLAGMLDWDAIVDRLRKKEGNQHWESPTEIVEAAVRSYKIDTWAEQIYRVEVWVEKEALAEIISSAALPLDVDYFACKGYVSQSAMWRAAQRMIAYEEEGQETIIIHLGDHDPSGIDMTRDIQDRLELFGTETEVRRIALTMEQIEELGPPPDPAKVTDPRGTGYVAEYGDKSWELDALEPAYLVDLVTTHVTRLRVNKVWKAALKKEKLELNLLTEAAEGIKRKLKKKGKKKGKKK